MADAPRYDFDAIDLDSGNVHADVVNFVEPGSRVLELGPATGYMSRAFVEQRECSVVGIEFDPGMAERAAAICERVIVGDLDHLDLEAELGDERFDAIVSADVIEHLKDPLGALRRLRPFLKDGGRFAISIPNVAHGSVRLALLSGRFEYRDWGLLDSTHMRFFTRDTFERLLDEAGLDLLELRPHELLLSAAEVEFDAAVLPAGLPEALEAEPDARAYQFVALAMPKAGGGSAAPAGESPSAPGTSGGSTLREAMDAREKERLRAESEALQGEIEGLRAENLRLAIRLERILTSPPARAYAVLRRLPGMSAVGRRRKAGYEADLERRSKGSETPVGAPLVSIVIVTHGAWSWAERAIGAAVVNTDVDHEIIVVDNASPDGTAEKVRERFPQVRLVANDDNAGFGAANNQAAEIARGEYLALVNSDAVVPAGWIAPLLAALERPGVGAATPALVNEDATMQIAGALAAPDGSVLALGNGDDVDDPAWRFARATDFGAAACMLLRRADFLAAGGFFDAYNPAYFEDADLCMTLLERGLRTIYVPEVRVLHGGFSSGGEAAAAELFERNRPTFVARWGAKLATTHPPSLWPPDPATTLAARDALAMGRALVLCDSIPAPDGELGTAARQVLEELPWARLTIAARDGDPAPWWRMGVEVLFRDDPAAMKAERAGHYDTVASPADFAAPETLVALRSAAARLEARIAESR
jgi:GT2 family glycosyltransferase/SAM-dependent methyltransferase